MEHGARLSTSRVMAIAFIFMSVLIVLSLSVNLIQGVNNYRCLLYTSPSPRDRTRSRMPSSA